MKALKYVVLPLFVLLIGLFVSACGSSGGNSQPDGDTDTPDGDVEEPTDGDTDGDTEKPVDGDEDGDAEAPDIESLVESGVFWLENGEAQIAGEFFMEAYAAVPDDPRAVFGYALTESMVGLETLGMIIQVALQPKVPEKSQDDDPSDFAEWIDKELVKTLGELNAHFMKSVELYSELKTLGGLNMTFTRIPIYLGIHETVWITGEIDDTDVYVLDGISRMMAMVFEFVTAHHVKSDLYTVIGMFGSDMLDVDLPAILNIVAYLLNYDEDFLAFQDDGSAKVDRTRELLLGALDDVLAAMVSAESERRDDPDQSDDFLTVDENGELVMNIWRYSTPEEGEEPQEELAARVIIDADTILAANALKNHILVGDDLAYVDQTVSPLISAAAMVAITCGLLDLVGVDLPIPDAALSPSTLTTLLNGLMKFNLLALDFQAYYADPKPLREMLPAWTSDKPEFENSLYLEWECPDELTDDGLPDGSGGFFCAGDEDTLVDAAHFAGTPYAIEADEHTVTTPYIAMSDPSFAGLLYVDWVGLRLAEGEEADWREADQYSFNAALAKVLSGILSFL